MSDATLPLKGGRKKAEPHPRTEGCVKLQGRRCYYARLYPHGSKRAKYVSTGRQDVGTAEQLLPAIRAEVNRKRAAATPPQQTSLL